MELFVERPERSKNASFKWGGLALLLLIGSLLLFFGCREGQRYLAVEKVAVTVQGEGYKIIEEDDDGDTDYNLYVRYSYEGKSYSGSYKTYDLKKDAEAQIGQWLPIQINPEKPSEQLNDIGTNVRFLCLMGTVFLSCGVGSAFSRKHKCYTEVYGWHREYIQADLNRKLLENCGSWVGFLFAGAIVLALRQVFPTVMGNMLIISMIAFVIGILVFFNWLSNLHKIRKGYYRLARNTLTDKKIDDSGDSTSYDLYYSNGTSTWHRSVSQKRFDAARIGETVEAVFLGDKKRPYFVYDHRDET